MASRPRRSAAQRATAAITDMADKDNTPERTMSPRSRRADTNARGNASFSRGPPSSEASSPADSNQHIHLKIKMPSSKLRQATAGKRNASSSRDSFVGGEIVTGKRSTRAGKKSYVVESESDEEDEEEEEEGEEMIVAGGTMVQDDDDDDDEDEDAEGEEDDDMDLGEEDADGEIDEAEMDVDAEGEEDLGEEDADGDIDMDVTPVPPSITVSKPSKSKRRGKNLPTSKATAKSTPAKASVKFDDDDDDELSELESEAEEMDETVEVAGEVGDEEDAEGEEDDMDGEDEEIEVVDEDAEGEEDLDSDDGGSRAGTPDLSRMTARQRAKHGDIQEYMKLSDGKHPHQHSAAWALC